MGVIMFEDYIKLKGAKLIFDELELGYLENENFIDKIKPLCDLAKAKCELDARKSI